MKKIYALSIFVLLSYLSFGQVIIAEDFSSGQMPPDGWTIDGLPAQWSSSNTSYAGGIAPEAKFTYQDITTTTRLVSPVIDMTTFTLDVTLTFKHFYFWYDNGPKIGVATRFGEGEWTSVWERTPTGLIGPETVFVTIPDYNGTDFQFCLYVTGNLVNVDWWYIDEIILYTILNLDAELNLITTQSFTNQSEEITGVLSNEGYETLTSFDVN